MESESAGTQSAAGARLLDQANTMAASRPLSRNGYPLSVEQWRRVGERLRLTPRESQIVRSLFQGLDEKQIAVRLEISPHTVHTHLGRLYRKLEVDSARAVLLAVFRELLPPSA